MSNFIGGMLVAIGLVWLFHIMLECAADRLNNIVNGTVLDAVEQHVITADQAKYICDHINERVKK